MNETLDARGLSANDLALVQNLIDRIRESNFESEREILKPILSEEGLDAIYEVLSHRYNSGETDVAKRHNEHQP